MTDVLIPSVGESVESGILTSWLKQEGEKVEEGDILFELETDKATMEVPATASGILHIKTDAGIEVKIGSVVAHINESEAPSANSGASGSASSTESVESKPQSTVPPRTLNDLSPAVRRLVEELKLDPSNIPASDTSGRLTKEDVQNYAQSINQSINQSIKADTATSAKPASSASEPAEQRSPSNQEPNSPRTLTTADSTAEPAPITPAPQSQTAPITSKAPTVQTVDRSQERVAMTNLRKRIAERLVQGKQESAHLTTFNEVNMQAVMNLRKAYKESFEKKHGVRLGFMSFFLKASLRALQDFPAVNAFVDGTDIVYNKFYDISVAISSERGLITPVVRNVDALSFADIELTILDFGKRAQTKKILPNELMGGTFTISNGGIFGSMLSTPIPNPPQTAILGMHSIQERPIVRAGEIVVAPIMYLALTYDHRILDGREAIGFLRTIKEAIEDPHRLLLEV